MNRCQTRRGKPDYPHFRECKVDVVHFQPLKPLLCHIRIQMAHTAGVKLDDLLPRCGRWFCVHIRSISASITPMRSSSFSFSMVLSAGWFSRPRRGHEVEEKNPFSFRLSRRDFFLTSLMSRRAGKNHPADKPLRNWRGWLRIEI